MRCHSDIGRNTAQSLRLPGFIAEWHKSSASPDS